MPRGPVLLHCWGVEEEAEVRQQVQGEGQAVEGDVLQLRPLLWLGKRLVIVLVQCEYLKVIVWVPPKCHLLRHMLTSG